MVPRKASAMIPFCIKVVFTEEKPEGGKQNKTKLPCFKLPECNKMVVGMEKQRKQNDKGTEGRCQVQELPLHSQSNPVSHCE